MWNTTAEEVVCPLFRIKSQRHMHRKYFLTTNRTNNKRNRGKGILILWKCKWRKANLTEGGRTHTRQRLASDVRRYDDSTATGSSAKEIQVIRCVQLNLIICIIKSVIRNAKQDPDRFLMFFFYYFKKKKKKKNIEPWRIRKSAWEGKREKRS